MGSALYTSVPTPHGKWAVVLLDKNGKCRQTLPCECETEAEARDYVNAYLRLYS
jgi:hypothetical protein